MREADAYDYLGTGMSMMAKEAPFRVEAIAGNILLEADPKYTSALGNYLLTK